MWLYALKETPEASAEGVQGVSASQHDSCLSCEEAETHKTVKPNFLFNTFLPFYFFQVHTIQSQHFPVIFFKTFAVLTEYH